MVGAIRQGFKGGFKDFDIFGWKRKRRRRKRRRRRRRRKSRKRSKRRRRRRWRRTTAPTKVSFRGRKRKATSGGQFEGNPPPIS